MFSHFPRSNTSSSVKSIRIVRPSFSTVTCRSFNNINLYDFNSSVDFACKTNPSKYELTFYILFLVCINYFLFSSITLFFTISLIRQNMTSQNYLLSVFQKIKNYWYTFCRILFMSIYQTNVEICRTNNYNPFLFFKRKVIPLVPKLVK